MVVRKVATSGFNRWGYENVNWWRDQSRKTRTTMLINALSRL